jgi:hypothetical protein
MGVSVAVGIRSGHPTGRLCGIRGPFGRSAQIRHCSFLTGHSEPRYPFPRRRADATREQTMSTSETTQKRRYVSLPWGRAELLEEVTFECASEGGEPAVVGVAHLREPDGSELVRFFYRSSGRMVRGPLTLRPAERAGLKAALAGSPRLRKLIRELV